MKRTTPLLLAAFLATSVFSVNAAADASRGKMVYMKKLKSVCKKDGIKNGGYFATKHNRREWAALKKSGKLEKEWLTICPSAEKKVHRLRDKDVKNLYDFIWKYASDGEVPSCG